MMYDLTTVSIYIRIAHKCTSILFLAFLWISGCCSDRSIMMTSDQLHVSDLLEHLLRPGAYNSRMRPGADYGQPLRVNVSLYVSDIYHISEAGMEFSVTFYLRQRWLDERLMFNTTSYNRSITLNYNQFDKVWTPDVFIRNLKSGYQHQVTVPNRLLRIFPDGVLLFSQRLSVTLSCDMHLEKYPMDNQTCHVNFGSYAYTTADMILTWDIAGSGGDPVAINPRITFPKFILREVTFSSCQVSYVTTGAYPCLEAYFHLHRRLRSYIFYVYLPSLLIVILSWLSFWIDLQAVPARISLGILTILTMATQNTNLNSDMPTMSITKALDVWMFVCMVFVFAAFLEYSVVNVLARKGRKQLTQDRLCRGQTHKNKMGFCPADSSHNCECTSEPCHLRPRHLNTVSMAEQDRLHRKVDCHVCSYNTAGSQSQVQQQARCDNGIRCDNHVRCGDQNRSCNHARCCLCISGCCPDQDNATNYTGCCFPGANKSAHFVDKVCRFVFPGLFLAFNIAYWIAYE